MNIHVACRVPMRAASESPRVRQVCAMFGLDSPSGHASPSRRGAIEGTNDAGQAHVGAELTIIPPMEISLPIPGPGVIYLTGPSGSGKSTLLRLMMAACAEQGVRVLSMDDRRSANSAAGACRESDAAIIDRIAAGEPLTCAFETLSLCGLGDAFIMQRREGELSDGQRFRFHLAQMMSEALPHAGPTLIAIDEFAATLDRLTASTLARNIRRWSDRRGVCFALATTHDDLIDDLEPDVLIRKGLGDAIDIDVRQRSTTPDREAEQSRRGRTHRAREVDVHRDEHADRQGRQCDDDEDRCPRQCSIGLVRWCVHGASVQSARFIDGADSFRIEAGTLDDYRALSRFHYRSHHPGAATSVLRLMFEGVGDGGVGEMLAGVLVRSLPMINCSLRDRATRGRYAHLNQKQRAFAVNREIRCISRVVIDPRLRGRGLAVRLVRFALENPEREGLLYTEALAAMGHVSPFFERAGMKRYAHASCTRPAYERFESALRHGDESLIAREAARFVQSVFRWPSTKLREMQSADIIIAARRRLLLQPAYYLFAHGDS